MFDWIAGFFRALLTPWFPCQGCGKQVRVVFDNEVWTVRDADNKEHRCRG